ncbi:LLM class flavin-dependent oxidoreductase [Mesorhizobium sp. M4B.F.Ca.ET.215.01.1.1]|uniref:LLM class flavin-dependent oxidoreductase n=1 Tax=Mesorhizobium abyssinicae TaxID=1209958 RepID=A0ABU5ARL9_9HYPH|nr:MULTISPECIES: LLM class flavin-dependent oxidoreductase [Mesorhizobium]MDX8539925.1 LLM class flavin-dependent oxidoreductase [Mesorhizobium abyssinicae]RUW26613.1 LLM class flavin-dependent oxidoreductase [Mesorhizobium sp. M4B.F.Ca.ET.013.02.1.1]RUW76987.1 LLM class flavin-dependent oxidoreductase [Mesorhizobium sp. M4B.F.Ca.ET.049.02.1.2]RWX70599.1 MsnO8 family LLM class oxidoreductase [Mesorhizobium sp. M4B.F.Ca.ET.089.01.1.1]TGQ06283.1 LLM class flavin-dependent oxidoreductase [Mesorhi
MTALSVLDLSPIAEGSDASRSLANSLDLARHAERLGYRRYWLAEHHNMPGIASAATSVVIAHVAGGTRTIRVGAGGIMLPNHAPLVIAEQFGTLAALFPGRIDLGLGRAPGTDMATARALRRNLEASDNFPQDVVELMGYFQPAEEGQRIRAVPGEGQKVPVWILGSSLYGAQLAALLGLPYAFASHFAPAELDHALEVYRSRFQPSAELDRPYVMLGLNVFAAPTDAEARLLFTSLQQAFVNLRTGRPGRLPPPVEGYEQTLDPMAKTMLGQALSCAVVGSPETVRQGIDAFVRRTGADELMVTAQVFDHAARVRSFEILADVHKSLSQAA